MAKDDLLSMEGSVVDASGGGTYRVLIASTGVTISARLSGRMKRYKIRVIVGDKVTVGISPYDRSHGLITHRQRLS